MKSRRFIALASAAAMALSAAGCSSGGTSNTGNAGGGSTGGTTATDNVLKVGTTQELAGVFCPMYATTAYDQWVTNMVYESMTEYTADNELVPVLAESLPEVSEDGKTLTFHLKPDQKFSDGSTLDGDDVKYTYTLMADPAYIGGFNDGSINFIKGFHDYQYGDATEVSGITVSDDKLTVTVECEVSDIDAAAALGTVWIMPDDQFEYTKGNLDAYQNMGAEEVIGSGAFKINKYDKSAGASVVRNENYTGDRTYNIDSVIVRTIGAGTEVASLKSGDIDLLPEEIDPGIIGPASLIDTIETESHFRPAEGYFGYNTVAGPTADVAVRQALSYATNRAEFCDAYYQWPDGQAAESIKDISVGYVPKAFWSPVATTLGAVTTGDTPLEGLQTYDYDIEKAKQILDDAGWTVGSDGIREKDGQKLEIKFLMTESNSVLDMLIPIITKDWTDLGVDLKTNTVDFNTLSTTVDPTNNDSVEDWNCFFMAVSYTGLSSTTLNLSEGFTGTDENPVPGGSNYARIIDDELNGYLNAGKETGDPEVSVENYSKAMVRASELCPYLAIYGNNLFNLYNKRVKNLHTGPVCNWSQALEGVSLGGDDAAADEPAESAESAVSTSEAE